MMDSVTPQANLTYGGSQPRSGTRTLATELAIALSYNGSTQAVMMATPADLVDFAYGFSLTEGLASPDEIQSVEVMQTPEGVDVQIWVTDAAQARLAARRRMMAGPVGCGLCGIDSLEQATRPPAPVSGALNLIADDVTAAVTDLAAHQPLHDVTRAMHAAALWVPEQGIMAAREDVGRHNALDKLAGHLARGRPVVGAVVITSRVSIDIVQKTAAMGMPVLIALSAPTFAAVQMADDAGITLICNVRSGGFDAYTHLNHIQGGARHVA